MEEIKKCQKCGGEMEPGYKLYPSISGYIPAKWVSKLKKKGLFGGLGYGLNEKIGIDITCYRCTKCGYLENYAK